jgi:hypothetical protein
LEREWAISFNAVEIGWSGPVNPTLDFLFDLRQPSHALERNDGSYKDDDPREDCAEIILARLVVAHHGPDYQHDPANDWNYAYEKDEHPFSDRNIIVVLRAVHTNRLMQQIAGQQTKVSDFASS